MEVEIIPVKIFGRYILISILLADLFNCSVRTSRPTSIVIDDVEINLELMNLDELSINFTLILSHVNII